MGKKRCLGKEQRAKEERQKGRSAKCSTGQEVGANSMLKTGNAYEFSSYHVDPEKGNNFIED